MQRQLLDPPGALSLEMTVRRLCGVQAQVPSAAAIAIGMRSERPVDVERALVDGRLVKTWAMRGTVHLLSPANAGAYLALMAAGRAWERASWQRHFGVTPAQLETLRPVIRDALAGRALSRDELASVVAADPRLARLGDALTLDWGTALKPFAWQGDICHGPSRGNRVTYVRPEDASARWGGMPGPDDAAALVLSAYFRAYGPATFDAFANWLAGGWFGKRRLAGFFAAFAPELVEVDVDGQRGLVLAVDVDELLATKPTRAVRLLPAFDQYLLGPGTGDGRLVAADRRAAVSRRSGWISAVVVRGGKVCGTWVLDQEIVRVSWFAEAGRPPRTALGAEVRRLSAVVGRELALAIAE